MRAFAVMSIVLASSVCVAAQGQWSPPAEVRTTALFACPGHLQIMATWPARCPYCGTPLRRVLTQAGGAAGAGTATAQPRTQQPMPGGGFGRTFPPNQGFGGEESEEPWEGGPEQVYPPIDFGRTYPNQGYGTQGYPNQGYGTGPDGYWPPSPPSQGPAPQQYPSPGHGQYPPSQGFPPEQYPYPPNDQRGQNEPNSGYGAILDELSRLFGRGRDTQQQPQ